VRVGSRARPSVSHTLCTHTSRPVSCVNSASVINLLYFSKRFFFEVFLHTAIRAIASRVCRESVIVVLCSGLELWCSNVGAYYRCKLKRLNTRLKVIFIFVFASFSYFYGLLDFINYKFTYGFSMLFVIRRLQSIEYHKINITDLCIVGR